MGCDAYADEKGTFSIEIYDYQRDASTSFATRKITISGLKPNHKIGIEIIDGEWR